MNHYSNKIDRLLPKAPHPFSVSIVLKAAHFLNGHLEPLHLAKDVGCDSSHHSAATKQPDCKEPADDDTSPSKQHRAGY